MLSISTQTQINVTRQSRVVSLQPSEARQGTQAFENLQAAILRLHTKLDFRSDRARHELRDNVERALEAYREYMRGETLPGAIG